MTASLSRLRLMQLISPALPIGGFTYSQGIEYAVEAGWLQSAEDLADWLSGLIEDNLSYLEIPVLARLYEAFRIGDIHSFRSWSRYLLASRETRELRLEEQQRAVALTRLLLDLEVEGVAELQPDLQMCQAAPFTLAALHWRIPLEDCALGYAWSWLETLVSAAIKLIPLGQTDGQRLLLCLSEGLPDAVESGLVLCDEQIGASSPMVALASSLHENQYTRLFRS